MLWCNYFLEGLHKKMAARWQDLVAGKNRAMSLRNNAPLNGGALHQIIVLTVLWQGIGKGGRP
jgi:hypothetical protein